MTICLADFINFFIGIIGPMIVPWWKKIHSISENNQLKELYGFDDKLGKDLEDNEAIGKIFPGETISNQVNGKLTPFMQELPGAYIGMIVWGAVNPLGENLYWSYFYILPLIVTLIFLYLLCHGCHSGILKVFLFIFLWFLRILTFIKAFHLESILLHKLGIYFV